MMVKVEIAQDWVENYLERLAQDGVGPELLPKYRNPKPIGQNVLSTVIEIAPTTEGEQ